jgi:hypothetical protein
MPDLRDSLTKEEALAVIHGAAVAAGRQTRDDLDKVLDWAREVRADEVLLRGVLDGVLGAYIRDGELCFKVIRAEGGERS